MLHSSYMDITAIEGGIYLFGTRKIKLDKLFVSLCEVHHKKVVKYLYYKIGDLEEANDLAQEVFTIVYKRIETLENHENVAGFIYQTAKFVVANHKRKLTKKGLFEEPLSEGTVLEDSMDVYDTLVEIEDRKVQEEDYLDQVMMAVSKDKQILYRMHYIEGKTYREIAQQLGVSEVSVRMRYVRLRREIKGVIHDIAQENFI